MDIMDTCETVKVQPWGEGQGDFVEINAEDFDPKVHDLYDPHDDKKGGSRKAPRARKPAK